MKKYFVLILMVIFLQSSGFDCGNTSGESSYFPHEMCNMWYECYDGILEVHTCPDNFMFNTELNVCDWAENVDCGNRPGGISWRENHLLVDVMMAKNMYTTYLVQVV